MEDEVFLSGYCRQLDASRTVAAETEDGVLTECDCCFGSCIYEPACSIAEALRKLVKE